MIPYPARVVGVPVTPDQGTVEALEAFPIKFGAVIFPDVIILPDAAMFPEIQRLFHRFVLDPMSFADEVEKGRRLQEIVRF